MLTQQIPKVELEKLFQELPEMIDVEDVMYRLYVFQKIQEGEQDIQEGRIFSHHQVVERLSEKWKS
jgi:hypothetical protein